MLQIPSKSENTTLSQRVLYVDSVDTVYYKRAIYTSLSNSGRSNSIQTRFLNTRFNDE